MKNDYFSALKNLKAAIHIQPPTENIAKILSKGDQKLFKNSIKFCGGEEYPALSGYVKTGEIADQHQFVTEAFALLVQALNNLDAYCRPLKSLYKRFVDSATDDNIKKTKAGDKWAQKPPTNVEVHEALRHVVGTQRILMKMAWVSPFYKWLITKQLSTQLVELAAAAHGGESSSSAAPCAQDSEESSTTPADEATCFLDQEYQNNLTGEPIDPSEVPEARVNDQEFASAQKPHAEQIVMEFVYWLRLVTSQAHHAHEFARKKLPRKIANLKFQMIEYPVPCPELEPWKDLVREMFPSRGEEHIRSMTRRNNRLPKGDQTIIGNDEFKFTGTVHCEVGLAVLHYASQQKEYVFSPHEV